METLTRPTLENPEVNEEIERRKGVLNDINAEIKLLEPSLDAKNFKEGVLFDILAKISHIIEICKKEESLMKGEKKFSDQEKFIGNIKKLREAFEMLRKYTESRLMDTISSIRNQIELQEKKGGALAELEYFFENMNTDTVALESGNK